MQIIDTSHENMYILLTEVVNEIFLVRSSVLRYLSVKF
jgi:hypothetical protein